MLRLATFRQQYYVFDPNRSFVSSVYLDNSHSHVILALKKAMRSVAHNYFIGWDNDWDSATTKVVQLIDTPVYW